MTFEEFKKAFTQQFNQASEVRPELKKYRLVFVDRNDCWLVTAQPLRWPDGGGGCYNHTVRGEAPAVTSAVEALIMTILCP